MDTGMPLPNSGNKIHFSNVSVFFLFFFLPRRSAKIPHYQKHRADRREFNSSQSTRSAGSTRRSIGFFCLKLHVWATIVGGITDVKLSTDCQIPQTKPEWRQTP